MKYLSANGLGPQTALAVIVGAAELPSYASRLPEVAQVCLEPENGPVGSAFKVSGYPAFCVLDGAGSAVAISYDPATLPEPASAR